MTQQTKAASKFIVEYVIRDSKGNIKAQGVEGVVEEGAENSAERE